MNPQLFKSTEFYHRRYHNMSTVLITPLILLVIFLFLFAFFAKKEVTVTSRGSIEPTKVIAVIQSTSDNTIIDNQLVANKVVKKGDTLVLVAFEAPLFAMPPWSLHTELRCPLF